MIYQWGEQRDYIASTWKCGSFLGNIFVLINLVGQIGASLMVLSRKKVEIGSYILFGIIALQTIAYWTRFISRDLKNRVLAKILIRTFSVLTVKNLSPHSILWDLKFLARSLSMVGGVLLILAENKKDTRNVFNAVPMMDDPSKSSKSYMQLSGRILLVLMFVSLLRFSNGIIGLGLSFLLMLFSRVADVNDKT